MKLLKPRFHRTARSGGGLFLGLMFHFPVSICDHVAELEGTEEEHYKRVSLVVGLIFWRLSFDLTCGHKRREAWRDAEQ
jgi:hypothetical protein